MREAVKDVPYNVSTSFVNLAEGLSIDEAVEFTQKLMSLYLKEETDKVELIYYHFRSMASQVISRDVFLPFQALPGRSSFAHAGYGIKRQAREAYSSGTPSTCIRPPWKQKDTLRNRTAPVF